MELSTDYQKFGLKIKHRLSTDYQKSENSQLVTFLLRCLYTILSVSGHRFELAILGLLDFEAECTFFSPLIEK